jgi:proline dehydrogenase
MTMPLINFTLTKAISLLPKWFAKPFAKPYVAGETIREAIDKIKILNEKGYLVTVDILGEHTKSKKEANRITEQYCLLYDQILEENLECSISVKPTHVGLDISSIEVMNNIGKILKKAEETGNFLRIDMESSSVTDKTIQIYEHFKKNSTNIGTVLQAYLLRTQTDLDKLSSSDINIRICKGIYDEPQKISFKDKNEINKNYILFAKKMARNNHFCAYATHDQILIDELVNWIENENISKELFEFQCLFGVPMEGRLEKLMEDGFKVRIYVPFGPDWYDYSMRRLNENPKIINYVLGNLFKND